MNAFYYACSYANIDYSRFMNITTRIALNLIPQDLGSQPVFLCIDDTMVPKSGKNLRMYQNSLTMRHTMAQTISTGIVL